jgi:acyl-CoA oxidase
MTPDPLLSDLRYLPYLPLIHLAWADGGLDADELERVRVLVTEKLRPGIDDEPVLARWLDPETPPTARELVQLRGRMRVAARRMPVSERRSLAELGLALARAEGSEPLAQVALAVAELQDLLGVAGQEPTDALLAELGVVQQEPQPASQVPSFDVGELARVLDGRHHAVRNQVRDLLASGALTHAVEQPRDAHRQWTLGQVKVLAEHGIGALAYPGVLGQSDDVGAFIAAFETLADGDLGVLVKAGVQFGLFGGSLYFLGTERHRALLDQVAAGSLLGCFAMSETGHGSNVRAMGTTATWDGVGFVLNTPDRASFKDYIGNAACHASHAVVFARLIVGDDDYGVHPLLVPIRMAGAPAPGVTIEDCGPKLGLNGVDNGRLAFDNVSVPRDALLDRFASVDAQGHYTSPINSPSRRFFTMLGTLVGGRVSVSCAAVGASRSGLAIALRYAADRRQFGPAGSAETPLLDYTSHHRRLLQPLADAVALTLANRDLTERYVARTADTARHIEALAAGLKVASTRHCTDTLQACREACGGAGYLDENRLGRLKADTEVFTTFEGDNTVLQLLVAKGVLTEFAGSLSEDRVFGVLRLVWNRARAGLTEWTGPRLSRGFCTSDLQLQVLQHRRDTLTWSLAARLRRRVDAGLSAAQALNQCSDHMSALATAWTEHHVLVCVQNAIEATPDDGVRQVLTLVRDVYALGRMDADQAWMLRHGLLDATEARALRTQLRDLLAELRPIALDVVRAFAIPERALGAPMAGVEPVAPEPQDPGVTGLGGVFLRCRDKAAQLAWYREHLGVPAEAWGAVFVWNEGAGRGYTVWSPFAHDTDYFEGPTMVNYRVRGMDALLERLRAAGVEIVGGPDTEPNGVFAWIRDPEGNRVELWEPVPSGQDPYL